MYVFGAPQHEVDTDRHACKQSVGLCDGDGTHRFGHHDSFRFESEVHPKRGFDSARLGITFVVEALETFRQQFDFFRVRARPESILLAQLIERAGDAR